MARSEPELLLLVSGNGARILQAHGFSPSGIDVVKIDEKNFASPKVILRLIRAKPYRAVYFGCDRLSAHRFSFIQKAFIALTTRRGGIVDELGTTSTYNFFTFLLAETPKVILELIVSILVVSWFHIQIFFDKRAMGKARR